MTADTDQLVAVIIGALEDLKAVNTTTLDVSGLTEVMDYMVIGRCNIIYIIMVNYQNIK